jgi:hypothetical protein
MAFNPLHWFRKRQKVFLAALAIMCMLLFVLNIGVKGADISDYLDRWFGWKFKGNTTEVASLYGKKQTVSNLIELRTRRQAADEFMRAAWERKISTFDTGTAKVLEKLEDPYKEDHNRARADIQKGGTSEDATRENFRHGLRALALLRDKLTKANKSEEAEAVADELRVYDYFIWEGVRKSQGQSYFGGGFKMDDLLDFDIWLHQADRLGIRFTHDDIRKLVEDDCPLKSLLSGNDAKDETEYHRLVPAAKNSKANIADLYQALGDEFRVRLAQASVLGVAPGVRSFHPGTGMAGEQIPAWPTPDEFWQYYRDNRTDIRVTLLTLPVADFLGKVEGTPSEEELRALWTRYKEMEPAPEREKPGFKEPRRVALEWVKADPDTEYYQKKSAELAPIVEGVTKLFPGFGSASPNVGTAVAGLYVDSLPAEELGIQAEYAKYLRENQRWMAKDNRSLLDPNSEIMARGPRRPENVATFVGDFLLGTCAIPDGVAASANAVLAEMGVTSSLNEQIAPRLRDLVGAGADPSIFGVLVRQAAAVYVPPEPLTDVRKYMVIRARKEYAQTLAQGELAEFKKKLDEHRSDPKAAAEFVKANAVPEKGISQRETTEPMDQYQFSTSEAVAPIRTEYLQQAAMMAQFGDNPVPFVGQFFGSDKQIYHPEQFPSFAFLRTNPRFRGLTLADPPPRILYWKTQDQSAYVPKFDEARKNVEYAWRFQKARELVRKEADTLAKDVREHTGEGGGAAYLRDLALTRGYRWFDPSGAISRVATAARPALSRDPTVYEPYTIPESVLSFPRSDTPEQLVRELVKPGDATVFRDRPEKTYYVAALITRNEPTLEQFRSVYQAAVPEGGFLSGRDLLLARLERERQRDFRKNMLKQLRTEAKAPLDEFGNYRIDLDVREQVDGKNREEQ